MSVCHYIVQPSGSAPFAWPPADIMHSTHVLLLANWICSKLVKTAVALVIRFIHYSVDRFGIKYEYKLKRFSNLPTGRVRNCEMSVLTQIGENRQVSSVRPGALRLYEQTVKRWAFTQNILCFNSFILWISCCPLASNAKVLTFLTRQTKC